MPLGTGNGVARNLGWGKKINKKWISSPKAVAEVMQTAAAMCRGMGESESQLGDVARQVAGLGLLELKVAHKSSLPLQEGHHVSHQSRSLMQ